MSALRVNVIIAGLCLLWGSTWVVIRDGLEHLPPLTSAAARFLLAALVMTAVAPVLARKEGGEKPTPRLYLSLGLLNFFASYGIVYTVEQVLPSGLVSVLWAVFPMMMAASGHFFLESERLVRRQALGFVVGFAGLFALFSTDVRLVGEEGLAMALLLLLSPIVSTVGTLVVKRDGGGTSSVLLNRNAMWVGAVALSLLALLTERGAPIEVSPRAVASVVYLALLGTVVTFGLYFWALRNAPAWKMSLIAYVTPAIALALGHVVKGEPFRMTTVVGGGLILLGIGLATRAPKPEETPAADGAPAPAAP